MASLARRIYRERRRTGFVAAMAGVSGALFYSHVPGTVAGLPVPVFTGALYAIAFGIATLTVSLVVPRFRFAMEAFAVARLLFAVVAAASPAVAMAVVTSPFLNATVVVLGGMLVARLAYGAPAARRFRRPAVTVAMRLPRGAASGLAPAADALARIGYVPGSSGARALLHRLAVEACGAGMEALPTRGHLLVPHGELPWAAWAAAWIDDAHGRLADACAPIATRPFATAAAGLRTA